jgi:four helix bundle protein
MASSFRDLRAWQEAAALSDDISRLVSRWPSFERWSLGIQLVRSADSIAANIAEAAGRWTQPDQRRLFVIARGSLYETENWLLRAEARGLMTSEPRRQLEALARALNGLVHQQKR